MSATHAIPAIEIRQCHTLAEFEECVGIEHRTWGGDLIVPAPLFVVAAHTGGQVLGAFDGGRMVGFTLAFAGSRDGGRSFLHSHMAAVLPEYRNRGIGRRLKLFQRKAALTGKIELIEWTFDPLETKNAHLNLNKLGAIARRLIPNCYGVTTSPLHHGLPTDRLVAEWWIASGRVHAKVDEGVPIGAPLETTKRVPLPGKWEQIRTADQAAAAEAQAGVRRQLETLFAEGYAIVQINVSASGNEYLLQRNSEIEGLKLPLESGTPASDRIR